jgi:hypothetical protein
MTQFGRDFANAGANHIQQGVENAVLETTMKNKDLATMSVHEL